VGKPLGNDEAETPDALTAQSTERARSPVATFDSLATSVGGKGGGNVDSKSLLQMVDQASSEHAERVGQLASGGMGTIDIVRDRALNRRSAMKRLHEHLETDGRSIRMFVREAQITGQLEHPNIVPVHELGLDGDKKLFFTMKLVEGRTLHDIVRALPPPPTEHALLLELLDIVIKVCDALAYAHSRGVLHCDIKPANIMVGDFGQVYLMDWGVARLLHVVNGDDAAERVASVAEAMPTDVARTEHGFLVGTPTHMSPEQAQGKSSDLDPRADVFAIGALVYHLLTRKAPYEAENYWQAILAAQQGQFLPIEEVVPVGTVPRALLGIVERAMAIDPAQRHASVAELRDDIVRFVRGGDAFRAITFGAGDVIVREGDRGEAAYIIQSGTCEAYKGVGPEKRVLRRMGPGEVFGEMAILSPGPRTATVVATTPMVVHVVNAEVLERELDALKPWFAAFVRTLAERFREREQRDK
jgi:serine/threonine-protein kinase